MHRRRFRERVPHLGHFVSRRLHRRIFSWFGATILLTGLVSSMMMAAFSDWSPTAWKREVHPC